MKHDAKLSCGRFRVLFSLFIAFTLFAMVAPRAADLPNVEIPYLKAWASSPHAKNDAEAFRHWDKEGKIEEACARCHSTPGYQDFIGADGSAQWVVDHPAPIGGGIECVACHNDVTRFLDHVVFPSGLEVTDLGDESRCMWCHQGRESTVSMNKAVSGLPEDDVNADLKFINIHYRAAAATRFGTEAKGAYEYSDKTYAGVYQHDEGIEACTDCHNPHTTEVNVDDCAVCHREVKSKEDFVNVRKLVGDFDGDGDVEEGIAFEIQALHEAVLSAIKTYAKEASGKAVGYEPHSYPYFFIDIDGNGTIEKEEATFKNKFDAWTPRMLKAAYNYQFVAKDPGAFTHNPVYVLQILHDSLADLRTKVSVAMDKMERP